jgi:transcriptional regulator with XRE-family HTH domain
MAASLLVSAHGLKTVDACRKLKGWNKLDEDWAEKAGVSTTTLRRFWEGRRIRHAHFKAICQAVGVDNWETLVEQEAIACSSSVQPELRKDGEKQEGETIADAIAPSAAAKAIATSSQPAHEAFAARSVALDSPFYVKRPPMESS